MLQVYDGIATEMFSSKGGTSKLVPTTFGDTQIHTRGNPSHQPLVFFHGISTNSLMFGDWLFPKLSENYFCIAVDTIGDMGRSLPRDGDPTNGPKNPQEMAKWALEVLQGLQIEETTKVHLLGYSMGCFIATCVAKYYPSRVHKLVLLAPVGVVAPVRKLWLAHAISFAILSKIFPSWESLRLWFFGSMMADTRCMKNLQYPEMREATDAIGGPQVNVRPEVFEMETLREIAQNCPTLLVIGRQESVVDPVVAIENAREANMKETVVYENAGHMFFCEPPSTTVIGKIEQFLFDVGSD